MTTEILLDFLLFGLIVILIVLIVETIKDTIAERKYKKYFSNIKYRRLATAIIVKTFREEDEFYLTYIYSIENQVYGGKVEVIGDYKTPLYPSKCYVLYSSLNPRFHVLLNDYIVPSEVNLNTIKEDYIVIRLKHTKGRTKEGWKARYSWDFFERD